MARSLVLAAAALLVGAVGGFSFHDVLRKPAPAQTAVAPAPATPEPVGPTLAEPAAAAPTPTPKLDAKIEVPAGDGKVAGKVLTQDGKPLAGARVRAKPMEEERPSKRGKREAEPSLEDEVRAFAARRQRERALEREAVSGPDGAYALAGLPAAAGYWLAAELDGYSLYPQMNGHEWPVHAGAEIDFSGRPRASIRATVLLPDGSAPKDANIWERRGTSSSGNGWTPASPEIDVSPGAFEVYATASAGESRHAHGHHGHAEDFKSDPQRVTVRAGDPPLELTFRLKSKPGIRGRVIAPQGEDAAVSVYALRFAGGAPPDAERLRRDGKSETVWTRDGTFALPGITSGTWLVGVGRQEEPLEVTQAVEVTDATVVLDLALPPPDRSRYVALTVAGPDGAPVADASVEVEARSGHDSSSSSVSVLKRGEGTYWVPLTDEARKAWAANEPGAQVTLKVSAADLGEKAVEIARGQADAAVRFDTPATLEVTIAGYAGSGLEGALALSLERAEAGAGDESVMMRRHFSRSRGEDDPLDAEGRQSFGPVEPGAYEVVLSVMNEGSRGRYALPAERVPVRLVAGKNEIAVSLPQLHSLAVLVEKPGGISLALERFGGIEALADDSRRVRFEHLPAGTYTLRFFEGDEHSKTYGQEQMTVTVPGPAEVRYRAQTLDAVRVDVHDPKGKLAQSGFQSGDYIIAIDGQEFESPDQMEALFMVSFSKEDAEFTVLRGTQMLQIPYKPKEWIKGPRGMGGSVEPAARPR